MNEFFNQAKASARLIARNLRHAAELRETSLAVRVVGEFSSGKTRFLRELFGDLVPPPLQPISSVEAQTLLPLEISYGSEATLELIRRASDDDQAEVARKLDAFPERKELASMVDPDLRLRLRLPEERLILKSGDGCHEGNSPRLLNIIDYPGWNSQDDARGMEALGLSSDWCNLALVYVCSATHAETPVNFRNLRVFLEALINGDLDQTVAKTPLLLIITHAAPGEGNALAARLENYMRGILGHDLETFPLLALALDFSVMDASELQRMRDAFWSHIAKAGLESGRPDASSLLGQVSGGELLHVYMLECMAWLDKLRRMHGDLKKNGKYMWGYGMRFFDGLDDSQIGVKAWEQWRKRAGPNLWPEAVAALPPPDLPLDHFMRPWLDAYWLPRLRQIQKRLSYFLEELRKSLLAVDSRMDNLEEWLAARLDWHYGRAAIPFSFEQLASQIRSMPPDMPGGVLCGTLIALSLMESRYAGDW